MHEQTPKGVKLKGKPNMAQLETIFNVLEELGGKAKYCDIYAEYEKQTNTPLTKGGRAGIRKVIEDHSSDSANFKGNDVFYSVYGKGRGVWGIREGLSLTSSGIEYAQKNQPQSSSTVDEKNGLLPDQQIERVLEELHDNLTNEEAFSPSSVEDARKIALRAVVQRRGQNDFRLRLLFAYKSRCCVTGETVVQVLEAAHIIPYRGDSTNRIQNGLLLRSDIHLLFDLRLLAINPENYEVAVSSKLKGSSYMKKFHGKTIRLPEKKEYYPAREALEDHWNLCRFEKVIVPQ